MALKDIPKASFPAKIQVVFTEGHLTAGEVPACPQRIEMDPNVPLEVDEATAAYLLSLPGTVRVDPELAPVPEAPAPDPIQPAQLDPLPPVQPDPIPSPAPVQEPSTAPEV